MKAVSWRAVVFCAAFALAGCLGEAGVARKTTKNGVQYVDLVEGTGPASVVGDEVYLAYEGTLSDGKQIARQDAATPAKFRVGWQAPLPGVDEGAEGMKVGGKRKLWIPSKMGYGIHGSTPQVPPNADLIFEVELIKLVPSEKVNVDAKKERDKLAEEAKQNREERLKILNQVETGKDIPEDQQKEVATLSGLKYVDERIGEGREALAGTTVAVLYIGRTSGKVFDKNLNRNNPFRVVLGAGKVIPGWEEGLVGMRAGGKRKLIVPPHLGYGANGSGTAIPPNATLVFNIELLKVL
jgi:peptidylprolyl isomerase